MDPIAEKKAEEAKAKFRAEMETSFGEGLVIYEHDKLGSFVFRKPTRLIVRKWKSSLQRKGADHDTCAVAFVVDCFCWPTKDEREPDYPRLDALFDDKPFASDTVFAKLAKSGGLDLDDSPKG